MPGLHLLRWAASSIRLQGPWRAAAAAPPASRVGPSRVAAAGLLALTTACSTRAHADHQDAADAAALDAGAAPAPSASISVVLVPPPEPPPEASSGLSAEPPPGPLAKVDPRQPTPPRPAGPCLPLPPGWAGDWGELAGLHVSCGGIGGYCEATRSPRGLKWRFRPPNLLSEGPAGPFAPVCITEGDSIFGRGFFVDRWPWDVVLVHGDTMHRNANAHDGGGQTVVLLDKARAPGVVPRWAVGDFVHTGGVFVVRVGENGVWVMEPPAGEGRRGIRFVSGEVSTPSPPSPGCIHLGGASWVGAPSGDLCQTRPAGLEFRLSNGLLPGKGPYPLRPTAYPVKGVPSPGGGEPEPAGPPWSRGGRSPREPW